MLTHPQRDHVGGAADVLEEIDVDVVLDPRLPVPSPYEREALAEARGRDVRVVTGRAGRVFRLGRLRLRLLWPDAPGPPGDDPNNRAIVLIASYGRIDALLTADAETNVTLPLRPSPVSPGSCSVFRPRVAGGRSCSSRSSLPSSSPGALARNMLRLPPPGCV